MTKESAPLHETSGYRPALESPPPAPEPVPRPLPAGPQDVGAEIAPLSIRPRDGLAPSAIEIPVFAQGGRATAWVSNGNYAGTSDRNLPLFALWLEPNPERATQRLRGADARSAQRNIDMP